MNVRYKLEKYILLDLDIVSSKFYDTETKIYKMTRTKEVQIVIILLIILLK